MDESIIEEYYNSLEFAEHRKDFEKRGVTKEQAYEYIKTNLLDKNQLKENLDSLTYKNIQNYFSGITENNKLSNMIETLLEKIFKNRIGDGNMINGFNKCIENLCKNHKKSEMLSSIEKDLNKSMKNNAQKFFNDKTFEKQCNDLVLCN